MDCGVISGLLFVCNMLSLLRGLIQNAVECVGVGL